MNIKVLKHFVYIQYGCGMQSLVGVAASTMTPQHHSGLAIPINPNMHPHLHMYYGTRVQQYDHPHHIKELKRFVLIQYGCGMQLVGVCSLQLTG